MESSIVVEEKKKNMCVELTQFLDRKSLQKSDFLPIFSYYRKHLEELDLSSFGVFDDILVKYQKQYFSRIEDEEVDEYYLEIIYSEVYNLYKEIKMHLEYPHDTNSLYILEDAFIELLREQTIDDVSYFDLLEKLYYLSDVVDENTFYVMHDILLYYQDIEKKEPSYILGFNDLNKLYGLVKKEYQKIKK